MTKEILHPISEKKTDLTFRSMDDRSVGTNWYGTVRGTNFWYDILFGTDFFWFGT